LLFRGVGLGVWAVAATALAHSEHQPLNPLCARHTAGYEAHSGLPRHTAGYQGIFGPIRADFPLPYP
jgi:hypothetical protein